MRSTSQPCGSKTMPWVPRLWHGMTISAWFSLLRENRFAIAPGRLPLAASVSVATPVNSLLAGVQSLLWKRRLAAFQLPDDPVFIVGHWRSGTTLLHELLALDPRHTYPNTYACLAPSHFLFSRYLVPWWLQLLMPKKRPMDNVRVGWQQPQEDEWALCLLGVPTVYRTVCFPRRLPQCPEHLTLDRLTSEELRRWDRALLQFFKSVMIEQEATRLILKSPPHTARVAHLHELFPKARFLHVVRDPLSVYPSTIRLWNRLAADHGLQLPDEAQLGDYVLDTFVRMYEAFETQRAGIPTHQICDVHYEQLVADPMGQLRRVYQHLDLGDFEAVRPHAQRKAEGMSSYQVNRYDLSTQQRERVLNRWRAFCERYGYGTRHSERRLAG